MDRLGVGYCDAGIYAGKGNVEIISQEACNDLCLMESQCKYAAWFPNAYCRRYNGKSCSLNGNTNYVTFAKHSTSNQIYCLLICSNIKRKLCFRLL